MKYIFLHISILACLACNAQVELNTYLSDWSKAGLYRCEFTPKRTIRLSPKADTAVSVNEDIEQAIRSLEGKPGMILLNEGKYLLTRTLNVPSNVMIKGMGPGKTIVYIQNSGTGHGFNIEGGLTGKRYAIEPLNRGDRTIQIRDEVPENLQWIRWIRDDSDLCRDNWCKAMTGQFFFIERRKGKTLHLHDAVRDSTRHDAQHTLAEVVPVENVFFEGFTVYRLDRTSGQFSNFHFNYAINCRVSDIESYYTNYAHVEMRNSAHIEVSGCYLTLSHGYGTGGRGYGTMVHLGSVNCLIIDNIFDVLRHSIILQAGANGNVFAFNYSLNPRQTTTVFGFEIENSLTGDLVLHGNYPYANLFEGNRASMAIADNSHGFSGPNNVFFKNHIGRNGLSVVEGNSNRVALINNRIEGPVLLLMGQNHLEINTMTPSALRRPSDIDIKNITSALRRMDKAFQKQYNDGLYLYGVELPAEQRYRSDIKATSAHAFPTPRTRGR